MVLEICPMKVNDQFSDDGIGWKTRENFVLSHYSVSTLLLSVWGPSIVSQIKLVC